MSQSALATFAGEARQLHDGAYPAIPIIGALDPEDDGLRGFVEALDERADAQTEIRREARAIVGAIRLLAVVGTRIGLEGTDRSWREIPRERTRRLDDGQLEGVIRAVNDRYLGPEQLEWTSHGIKRTFRYWSEEEISAYLQACSDVVALLRARVGEACFAYGLVLSLARGGAGPISHDDDVDVLVALPVEEYPTFQAALGPISEMLTAEGYEVSHAHGMGTHRWVTRPGQKPLDVFVGLIERGTVASYPGPRRKLRVEDVFPPTDVEVHGVSCAIPAQPERYVKLVYGRDWRVPRIVYAHRGSGWWQFADLDADAPPTRPWTGTVARAKRLRYAVDALDRRIPRIERR